MASTITVPSPAAFQKPIAEAELLLRRNEELERELRESKRREEKAAEELRRVRERLRQAEEAEERLCFELGELEAESLCQARDYHRRIADLAEQLARVQVVVL
ncbi:hypothetical protein QJS10_CPB11g01887 [Acorus calamus]|uniref:Uncharacterized protein n=1 Tax=Acorus calamus TaxID=4465 RepID=A0AAV9DTN1_ACOCL|nr:hypothetical protein QJS10_CPB11g01871 [Acorus calamus]KAK1304609.1 hypothetical protein QJS10_CPB11g01887 [Acorus calamus]